MTECERFEGEVVELAAGTAIEPARSELLAHASACSRCRRVLVDTAAVVDEALHLAPGVEPPAGFETRALAAMGEASPSSTKVRRTTARATVAAVVALAVGLAAGAVARDVASDGGERRTGQIISRRGGDLGDVALVSAGETTTLVLAMPDDGSWPGTWTCELRTDGRWTSVGAWKASEVRAGVWATGVDRRHASATAMRILDDDGDVIAHADLRRG